MERLHSDRATDVAKEASLSQLVFLVGAGASMDAGLPSVVQLTTELRSRLATLRDVNGVHRPEFAELFNQIMTYDQDVVHNYERFFEWLKFLGQVQRNPWSGAVRIAIEQRLAEAVGPLSFVIKRPIWEILRTRHCGAEYEPHYLARLRDFLPQRGRLKVFSLNYDLCVEDACRTDGTRVITGFHPDTRRWMPSVFAEDSVGINLYKLHGSLNWRSGEIEGLVEDYPPRWDLEPDLLLGPGLKLEPDDPYGRLHCELQNALSTAEVCVVIGYGFRDTAITTLLRQADRRGMRVIDLNPSASQDVFAHYLRLGCGAKIALERDDLRHALTYV
jgi:hypothetical protein